MLTFADALTANGVQMQNAPGFLNAGTTVRWQGTWSALKGTKDNPDGIVYRLTTTERPARSTQFAKIGDNLLHLLSDDKSLAVGNASWSYTLSRAVAAPSRDVSQQFKPETSAHRNMAGVFEGRTPCQEVARELGVAVAGDCSKLEWRLTLLQDPATGAPTSYKLEGTL